MRLSRHAACAALFIACAASAPTRAEVTEASEYGFALSHSFEATVSANEAFDAFARVADWWSPAHTYSRDAARMSLAIEAGGCFCEVWPGGAVKHAEVAQVRERRYVRMLGALGPLQDLGVTQVHDWTVERTDTGSRVTYFTRVSGRPGDGLVELAPIVDGVMAEQMSRLQRFIATGNPDAGP
jgi:hypothetical protein